MFVKTVGFARAASQKNLDLIYIDLAAGIKRVMPVPSADTRYNLTPIFSVFTRSRSFTDNQPISLIGFQPTSTTENQN